MNTLGSKVLTIIVTITVLVRDLRKILIVGYSNFSLSLCLNSTGTRDKTANPASSKTEVMLSVLEELEISWSVPPAWIARNDGGATPKI